VFLLIKKSLVNSWETNLKNVLNNQDYAHRYANIKWLNYDSPYANTEFLNLVKKTESNLKNLYIIDEVHNFIRNVFSNLSSKKGKRAIEIYEYMLQDKKDNPSTRVILLSGTPAINKPFELALLFNLLRPGLFPKSEVLFNQIYVDNSKTPSINPQTKNMFQRRIMGLVSYYIGGTPDLYATQTVHYIDLKMSKYQTEIYEFYEEEERKMEKKKTFSSISSNSEIYKTYVRQASNFVFPPINQLVSGETRPRPSKFKIGDKEMELLLRTKNTEIIKKAQKSSQSQGYFKMLDKFKETFDKHLETIYLKELDTKINIKNDVENFKKYNSFEEYWENEKSKSQLIQEMYKCSVKFINIIYNVLKSQGPVLIYSNYVLIEGIDMIKVYLKYFGFDSFKNPKSKDYFRYAEFHADIKYEVRNETIKIEIKKENCYGKLIKIVMFSPAGSEGISLESIRQVHLTEPYWNEVRMIQMIGRAVRQCSHKYLPLKERHVDIYRYRTLKHNIKIQEIIEGQTSKKVTKIIEDLNDLKTVDFDIQESASNKNNLISTFLDAIKEVAIDCELFKAHNMMASKYRCFQFNETSLFDKNIGPAYKEDTIEDMKISNGLNSLNSIVIKVKVVKIRGIIETNEEEILHYWYNSESGTVYDFDLNYPIGKVKYDDSGIPEKLDKDTYRIEIIHIPMMNQ
jgi:hypothetical protein